MGAPGAQARSIRFGAFELVPESRELRKSGVRLKLAEQPVRLLLCLLERPGEVVTREEFRGLLWGDDTFVDFEHGLNAAMNKLREALGDSAANPRFIETVPRRGYRFIAEVHRPGGEKTSLKVVEIPFEPPGEPSPTLTPPKRGFSRLAVSLAVLGAGLLGALAWWAWSVRLSSRV